MPVQPLLCHCIPSPRGKRDRELALPRGSGRAWLRLALAFSAIQQVLLQRNTRGLGTVLANVAQCTHKELERLYSHSENSLGPKVLAGS